jgi:uncharacterized protein YukE
MSCEEEKNKTDDARARADAAEWAYNHAYDDYLNALSAAEAARQAADASCDAHWYSNFTGECSDALEKKAEADEAYNEAFAEFEQREQAYEDALDALDDAIQDECACYDAEDAAFGPNA